MASPASTTAEPLQCTEDDEGRHRPGEAARDRIDEVGFGSHWNEEGSACGASAPGQLVNAKNPQRSCTAPSVRAALEMPQHRVPAYRDAKLAQQPARGFTSSSVAHRRQDIGDGDALANARGEVAQASLIPAMLPPGDGPARWTSWQRAALSLDSPLISNPADRVDVRGRTGRTDALLCHERQSTPLHNTRLYRHRVYG
jgi:hypothetical protein